MNLRNVLINVEVEKLKQLELELNLNLDQQVKDKQLNNLNTIGYDKQVHSTRKQHFRI